MIKIKANISLYLDFEGPEKELKFLKGQISDFIDVVTNDNEFIKSAKSYTNTKKEYEVY